VIAVDTNILVYAHREESAFHHEAFQAIKELAEGANPRGLPVACPHEFLSIVTNSKVFNPASTFDKAIAQGDGWLESPSVQILHSRSHHWKTRCEIARKGKLAGGVFHDARIAAICIENGVREFRTAARDFAKQIANGSRKKVLKLPSLIENSLPEGVAFFVNTKGIAVSFFLYV
jgi:uncharacterized protein